MGEQAIAEVRAALRDVVACVEHIGSTAVPGLAAKPIIDVMASTARLDDVARRAPALAAIDFQPRDSGMPGRLLFVRAAGAVRIHHLHIVTTTGWETRNQRLFRDYLRTHPAAVQRYASLKLQLAAGRATSVQYTEAKTALIQELTDAARRERGLQAGPVWE